MAAKDFHYTWEEFCELDGERQSDVLAAYRAEKQIEAVINKVHADEMKRKQPRRRH